MISMGWLIFSVYSQLCGRYLTPACRAWPSKARATVSQRIATAFDLSNVANAHNSCLSQSSRVLTSRFPKALALTFSQGSHCSVLAAARMAGKQRSKPLQRKELAGSIVPTSQQEHLCKCREITQSNVLSKASGSQSQML